MFSSKNFPAKAIKKCFFQDCGHGGIFSPMSRGIEV